MSSAPPTISAFTDAQYDHVYPKGIEHHFWCIARDAIISDMVRSIEERDGARVGRMLEIGCGRGMVVAHLRGEHRDCYGVELSPVTVPKELEGHVWSGTDCRDLPQAFRAGVYLVMLLEVIEHIEDSTRFLADIRDAFPNCRWLIVSVPARRELWSNFDEQYGHFRRYDIAMLRAELERAGAEHVWSRYRFILLYPLLYLMARSGVARPLSNSVPTLRLLHRIVAALIRRETWIFPRWAYGASIYAIGRFPGRMRAALN